MFYLKEDQWKLKESKKWISELIIGIEKDKKERVAMALADISNRYNTKEKQDNYISHK